MPPLARSTEEAAMCPVSPLLFMRWTPRTRPSSMQSSVVNSNSQTEICFNVFALARRVRKISRPVESPWACRMRLRLCAPLRVRTSASCRRGQTLCPTESVLQCVPEHLPRGLLPLQDCRDHHLRSTCPEDAG